MADVKTLVDTKIAGKKVMVFSKSSCPYCKDAKAALKKENLSPEDIEIWEIGSDSNCRAIQDYLKKLTGASTVPRVFIKGKCIGGGDETVAAQRSGKLAKLLA